MLNLPRAFPLLKAFAGACTRSIIRVCAPWLPRRLTWALPSAANAPSSWIQIPRNIIVESSPRTSFMIVSVKWTTFVYFGTNKALSSYQRDSNPDSLFACQEYCWLLVPIELDICGSSFACIVPCQHWIQHSSSTPNCMARCRGIDGFAWFA